VSPGFGQPIAFEPTKEKKYPLCEKVLGFNFNDGTGYVSIDTLELILSKATVVFGKANEHTNLVHDWKVDVPLGWSTHHALLIAIEPIKRECMEHKPALFPWTILTPTANEKSSEPDLITKCIHCNKMLKAVWSEA
jgi:hypothetical protein